MTLWMELFIVSHHLAKCGCPGHCDSGDGMFLICHLTSHDQMILAQYCIPYRTWTFGRQCKSNDWFIYGVQHLAEMG